ncbi:MAG: hypothetical protein HYX89_06540 [Chloroflexi bacterium]|nr:hypothetical protein [Chloroflexota bacterium]
MTPSQRFDRRTLWATKLATEAVAALYHLVAGLAQGLLNSYADQRGCAVIPLDDALIAVSNKSAFDRLADRLADSLSPPHIMPQHIVQSFLLQPHIIPEVGLFYTILTLIHTLA